MKEIVLALLAGVIVGFIFKLIKLPLPAPPVMAGIMGIFGIYFGGLLADRILQFLQ
jgi:XapX domain-containing protein